MAMDPEVSAEITAIKNKLLKLESDLSEKTGKEWTETKREIADLKTTLTELIGKKKDPAPDPKLGSSPLPEADPLGDFIEQGKV